jgi:hypothetical protein
MLFSVVNENPSRLRYRALQCPSSGARERTGVRKCALEPLKRALLDGPIAWRTGQLYSVHPFRYAQL